jgi:mannosyl-3-phosphoglycerate phosphatase
LRNSFPKVAVFTDLDGTLIDEQYGYAGTQEIVARLLALDAAVILSSSKTSAEIERYRKDLNIGDPFISENGAAVFVPKEYFKLSFGFTRQTDEYQIIELGTPYQLLRRKLEKVKEETGADIVGFGDMSIEEVAKDSGLSLEMAKLAKQREYDEPFRIVKGDKAQVVRLLRQEGLTVTEGDRYYHLTGEHNKGVAVAQLNELFLKNFGRIPTFGVGNGANDLEMLKAVERAFFVSKTEEIASVWKQVLTEVTQVLSKNPST